MPGTDTHTDGGSRSAAISKLTVGLFSQYTGRGPTRAHTYLNEDMVTVVLQDTLTKAETTLLDNGRDELVLVTRRTFQEVMGPDLIAGIEQVMQRKVLAFLSANHVNPDVAVETFLLKPLTEHTPAQQLASPPSRRPRR